MDDIDKSNKSISLADQTQTMRNRPLAELDTLLAGVPDNLRNFYSVLLQSTGQ